MFKQSKSIAIGGENMIPIKDFEWIYDCIFEIDFDLESIKDLEEFGKIYEQQ